MFKIFLRAGWFVGSGILVCALGFFYLRVSMVLSFFVRHEVELTQEVAADGAPTLFIGLALTQGADTIPDNGRDVFSFAVGRDVEALPGVPDRSLRVVGLIVGERSGVILEDLLNGQTVFLSEGETKGDLALVKVEASGARLRVSGRELSLNAPSRVE